MKTKYVLAAGALSFAFAAMAAAERSHCTADEETLFTCRMANKVLSFCAARSPEGVAPAWVQYRYGRIGATELVYPVEKRAPGGHFRYSRESGGRWGSSFVQFSVDGHTYFLDAYANSNIPESGASLLVVRPDGSRRVLRCADPGLDAAAGLTPLEQFHLPEVQMEFRK